MVGQGHQYMCCECPGSVSNISDELQQEALCENQFLAVQKAQLSSKVCNITGCVIVACARHGCFCLTSFADLEQQKNIDWAFMQALNATNTKGIKHVMILYDIASQYYVNLFKHIGLELPPDMIIDCSIGLFHIHGHKDDCLYNFSPMFIKGSRQVAREILESLWLRLDTISPSTQTATKEHRVEILDNYIVDSNWKKMVNMGKVSILFIRRVVAHCHSKLHCHGFVLCNGCIC